MRWQRKLVETSRREDCPVWGERPRRASRPASQRCTRRVRFRGRSPCIRTSLPFAGADPA
eukprot:scaffold7371_cov171-Pinguiococcus_pyrenoidosus.AAC.2